METVMTVRLDARQAKALAAAVRRTKKTASDIVRDALDRALTTQTIAERAGHLKGRLSLARESEPLRASLRARNWRA